MDGAPLISKRKQAALQPLHSSFRAPALSPVNHLRRQLASAAARSGQGSTAGLALRSSALFRVVANYPWNHCLSGSFPAVALRETLGESMFPIWRKPVKPQIPLSSGAEGRRSVLVLEDNIFQATDLADVLEAAGYRVLGPIRSVREAMRVLEVDHIDGALLDIKLGDDNSMQVAETLAKRSIPVLFVSGFPKPDSPAFEKLAYLAKPYTEEQLLHSVAALFGVNSGRT